VAPDCVVLHLHMSDLSGLDTLRTLHTKYMDLPVIAITDHDEHGLRAGCTAPGVRAYLIKPVE
jgi:CheY-like chemotaxis protein